MISIDEDIEKLESSYVSGEMVKWCSHFGKLFTSFLNCWMELSYDPAVLLLGTNPRELKTHMYITYMCVYVHCTYICIHTHAHKALYINVHSSIIIAKEQEKKNGHLQWTDKQTWYIHIVEYLGNVLLSVRSQSQKAMCTMWWHFCEISKIGKSIDQR